MMLWGLTLFPGIIVKETVEYDVHLSMAALETRQEYTSKADGQAQVIVQTERGQFVVCTLVYGGLLQQALDMEIKAGEMVTLFSHGKGVIHLTGNASDVPSGIGERGADIREGSHKAGTERTPAAIVHCNDEKEHDSGVQVFDEVTIKEEPVNSDDQPDEASSVTSVSMETTSPDQTIKKAPKKKSPKRKKKTENSKDEICEICGKKSASVHQHKAHMLSHSEERPHICPTCGKGFKMLASLSTHLRIHSGEKPYSCKSCQKAFSDLGTCRRHEKIHSGDRPFLCNYCDKGFPEKAALIRHERIHTGEKPYSCSTCPKTFSDKGQQKRHERSHLVGPERAKYNGQCNDCGKILKDASSLRRHKLLHSDSKPYICQICSKAFNDQSTLRQHYRMHDRLAKDKATIKCVYCLATFRDISEFNEHNANDCSGVDRSSAVTLQIERVAVESADDIEEEEMS